jgi:hypothetical protein
VSAAYERVTETLIAHGSKSRDVRENRAMWQCPAHADNNPSLEVKAKHDKVILACYAGCQTDDVVQALGLEWKDLFDGELPARSTSPYGVLVRSYLYEKVNGDPYFHVDRYFPKTFRQRLAGVDPVHDLSERDAAKRLGLSGQVRPIIYHAPRVWRALQGGEATVWWLDGEKDVERAEKEGLVATCAPGFAKWDEAYATFLKDAKEIVMVVDQDKEKPDGSLGAGHLAAMEARAGFRSVGLHVRVVKAAVGKDFSDHFDAGYGLDDFTVDTNLAARPRGLLANVLANMEFEPIRWVVQDILPSAGLTIFAGSPKIGKSWVCLDMAASVAGGQNALGGTLRTTGGNVLYLAREDSYRRLQSRLAYVMGGDLDAVPPTLELVPQDVPWIGGEEGIGHLTEWAEEAEDPRLVIIDTLVKLEPEMGEDRRRGAYQGNSHMIGRYKQWADTFNVSVFIVHHDSKVGAREKSGMENNPFLKISGTQGLTGAADTLWFLETERGTGEGELHITGRDVVEQSLPMRKHGAVWAAFGIPRQT